MTTTRGKFISFEGIDGAGKSTHIGFVADWLRSKGITLLTTREPGGTPLGEQLREIVLHQEMHLETEALLMFAARREHLARVIEPALQRGEWVISDRFTDASFAYQGGGRHLARGKLETLEQWVHPHVQPNLTLLFDLSPEVANARMQASRDMDRFEQETSRFFIDTRNEYLRRAAEFSQRFRVIDSSRSVADVQAHLLQLLAELTQP